MARTHSLSFPLKQEDNADKYSLAITEWKSIVRDAYTRTSLFEPLVSFHELKGTNSLSADALGNVSVGIITPGDSLPASAPARDRVSVEVDKVLATRYEQFILDKEQDDINILSRMPWKQGKAMAKRTDLVVLNQIIRASLTTDGMLNEMPGGFTSTFATAADALDPDKLYAAMEALVIAMEDADVDTMDMRFVLPTAQYYTLLKHDKLMDGDFVTANGDFAKAKIIRALDVPIFKYNRFPTATYDDPLGDHYDVTADHLRCRGVLFTADSLLAARAISETTETNYDFDTKVFQVDTFTAIGVDTYDPAQAGSLLIPAA